MSMAKSRLNKELLEYRKHRTTVWAVTLTKMIKYVTTATATIISSWFAYLSIDSLSGLDTDAEINVVFDIIKNTSTRTIIVFCVGIGGLVYGLRERILRVRKVSHLSSRIKDLEQAVDKDRQSSSLNRTGSTRREDE